MRYVFSLVCIVFIGIFFSISFVSAEYVPKRCFVLKEQMSRSNSENPQWKKTLINEKFLKKAEVHEDIFEKPAIYILFNNRGRILLRALTSRNLGRQIPIFIDDELISSPIVNDIIKNGEVLIVGKFTFPEAEILASKLNECRYRRQI